MLRTKPLRPELLHKRLTSLKPLKPAKALKKTRAVQKVKSLTLPKVSSVKFPNLSRKRRDLARRPDKARRPK